MLKTFKKFFLSEAISAGSFNKASTIIKQYLAKKVNDDLFPYPSAEVDYPNSIRFFLPKKGQSFRINFTGSGGSLELSTVDIWKGEQKETITFDKSVSLAQVLPVIADIVNGKAGGKFVYATSDEGIVGEEFEGLFEATNDLVSAVMAFITKNEFTQSEIYDRFRAPGYKIYRELLIQYPNALKKDGRKTSWVGDDKTTEAIIQNGSDLLNKSGVVRGTISAGKTEVEKEDPALKGLEDTYGRLAFEKQLEDLKRLIKLVVVSKTANALFVAGRGGIGKTHTVEEVLGELGKKDGNGYFKNTGSISAAGLYMTLYRHRDGIVFFDDTDDVFKDQTSRNILKAATDTKKVRKLVWNKAGSNVVDPSELEDEGEDIDTTKIPRYFEFTGQVIFISNLPKEKLDPDGAIQTRSFIIDINPTDEEVYDFMEKIADKVPLAEGAKLDHDQRMYVIKLLRTSKSKQTANLRKLSRGLNMYAGTIKAGVNINDSELSRMIAMYA